MLVNSGISNLGVNDSSKTLQYNNVSNLASAKPVYKSDSVSFNNFQKDSTIIDSKPPKSFFERSDVRLTAKVIGSGIVFGGVGYAVGASMGAARTGLAIGSTLGILAPVALIGLALLSIM